MAWVADISGVAIRNARLVSDLRTKNQALVETHNRVAELNAKLEGRVKKQVAELAEVRQELAASREVLGLRHDYRKIIGESARPDELDVNPTKEKKLTNMRAAGSDDTVWLTPPRPLSLEQALEFIADDEYVEVTPTSLRLRKAELSATVRGRTRKRLAAARS